MATTSEQINALAGTSVVVHPLVLLSVVDHAHRSPTSAKKRVLGVLLGQNDGKTVNVANSFAVPFEEDEKDPKTWFLDLDYVESMWEMFRKVNAKEKPIGFYHTGPTLRSSDLEISELFKRFVPKPVMVIVDVRPTGGRGDTGIPTDAYFAVEEIKDDGTTTQKTFMHVPSLISAEEAEEIGVEHLLRDISAPLSTSGSLSSRVSAQLSALKGLHSRLIDIRDYLAKVLAGEMAVNHQIIYNLQDVFNLLPPGMMSGLDGVSSEDDVEGGKGRLEVEKSFRVATNDQMLVVYLSSLIRAVIALHNLVDNKLVNSRAESDPTEDTPVPATPSAVPASEDAKKPEEPKK
ncbi:26S proteasome regulatory complex, subunit RPN8/PSMD7 [Phaffia rhodozyma]|uniref:26S proteasome regulatory complex, subunit RPN8/PSMD7 n=1 Tax=Phaffia rhodozyma TaxID=264483 RepID=A0A0F7SF86_PHARH|nr:26S proteasome regulatory complex, subunit RPN8/PSMD7 [Phaffia rhodozyma]